MTTQSEFILTGTPLDDMLTAILIDPGLNDPSASTATQEEIVEGAYWASVMNGLLVEAIETLGLADDGNFSEADILAINSYIRSDEDRLATWTQAHGSEAFIQGAETGFHLVENDHANSFIFNRHIVNDILDAIYHIGFEFDGNAFLGDGGIAEGTLSNVTQWLNGIFFGPKMVLGTTGDDVFIPTGEAEFFNGGAGYDIVDYSSATSGQNVNIGTQTGEGTLSNGDQLTAIDELIGTAFDDTLTGSEENEVIRGGDGEDQINGYWGDDIIYGGAGNDILRGDNGDDFVYGGDGDDIIYAQTDGDYIDAGDGIDWVRYEPWMVQEMVIDLEAGFVQGTAGAACHDILLNVENVAIDSDQSNEVYGSSVDNIIYGGRAADIIDGRAGNDTLKGNEGDDTISGGDGNDILEGYVGDDILEGGAGNDSLHGGDGTDTAIFSGNLEDYDISQIQNGYRLIDTRANGSDGTDDVLFVENFEFANGVVVAAEDLISSEPETDLIQLIGSDSGNVLYGSNADEYLEGNGGNDNIFGGGGNDIALGGDGDDFVRGGAGQNTISGGEGNDYLYTFADGDIIDGGNGLDWLRFEGNTGAIELDLSAGTLSSENGADSTVDSIERVTATANDDTIIGGSAGELILGQNGDDVIKGGDGADIIRGEVGNDTLYGDNGNDNLQGYVGNDTLSGGAGVDILNGGAGNDTFIFGADAYTLDIIQDFSAGAGSDDVIQISTDLATDFDELMLFANQSGARTVVQFDSSNTIYLENTDVDDLHADDFIFVDPALIA